jgi:chromosome segregation ATPase
LESVTGVEQTARNEKPQRVRRVRRIAAIKRPTPKAKKSKKEPVEEAPKELPEWKEEPELGEEDASTGYKFVKVPPLEGPEAEDTALLSLRQQVEELYNDFAQTVVLSDDSFSMFMMWASEAEGVNFQDLLIATRSIFDIMERPLPGDSAMWSEFKETAQLVEITRVSDSELEYALEVFSKVFDLYKDELRRLEEERSEAERLASQRISEEILAEDENLLGSAPEEPSEAQPVTETVVDRDRWDKIEDDTRSKINSTKAEFDELVEELTPFKAERDAAISRLRVLEKEANRKKARLEWFQRGRISEAKAEEISNLEKELEVIEGQSSEWGARLAAAQQRLDVSMDQFQAKRAEFDHIKSEVESLVASLPSEDSQAMRSALSDELMDLGNIVSDVDEWIGDLVTEGEAEPSPEDLMEGTVTIEGVPVAPSSSEEGPVEEPPVVFMDSEVRAMLEELPMDRTPEEELTVRLDRLQLELINRENTIMELEHTIERLMEDKEGSTTAVELERNKVRLELAKTQEELTETHQLLEQYLQVIKDLEDQMERKDGELRETLALNRRKTEELRQKETALASLERELLEKQEEFKSERQELQDREARLNAQIEDRESQEREIAKKELTLELRNEQIRKKMDRLNARELEVQRMLSDHKETEEMLSLKERELQNLKAELDIREDEQRRRETAIEDRSTEAKKLQSELSKLEHRLKTRDEQVRRREATQGESDQRIKHLETTLADREIQLQASEEGLSLRESELEASQESLEEQRDKLDSLRRQVTEERQDMERLRLKQERRHEELLRHEDQLATREKTLQERDRGAQLKEERLGLERKDIDQLKGQAEALQKKWEAKEATLLTQLQTYNTEKEQLIKDWKASKKRLRQLEREKNTIAARLLAVETAVMEKDEELLNMANELEEARGGTIDDAVMELDDGTKASLKRIMEDLERNRALLKDFEERTAELDKRESELVDMEDVLNLEREKVRELLAQQERGETELREALEEIENKAKAIETSEQDLAERERAERELESQLMEREATLRAREADLERLTTSEAAKARAEEREEEMVGLQRDFEERVRALERREEELEDKRAALERSEGEIERQKAELFQARENLLKAQGELEEIPAPATPPAPPERAKGGLAEKAAEMAAKTQDVFVPGPPPAPTVEVTEARKPLARLRCRMCGTVIPIFTEDRPLKVVCPKCGKAGEIT